MVKKEKTDFRVVENTRLRGMYSLLKLTPVNGGEICHCEPGQFVQVLAPKSAGVLLRRPISINYIDTLRHEMWLLVRRAGSATDAIADVSSGSVLNLILPLGNGFSLPSRTDTKILLIGGGVGVAPLLYFGSWLRERGYQPQFLLGARSKADLLEVDMFEAIGTTYISTDDGSCGEPGLVTANSALRPGIEKIYCCGPAPMMKAVAKSARQIGAECEVSLENMMACGLGACLCCVEKTVKGNVCVCTDGPVFNIDDLTWQI